MPGSFWKARSALARHHHHPIHYRLLACLLALVIPAGVAAQQPGSQPITEAQFLEYLQALLRDPLPQPQATNFGVVTGFGLPHGSAFAAGVLTDKRERNQSSDHDGSAALGIGLGDARRLVGMEVTLGIISTTPSEFAEDGNINFKLHRVLPGLTHQGISSVAIGVGNAARWGDAREVDRNRYISASTVFNANPGNPGRPVPMMLTAGYGTAISNLGRDADDFYGLGVGLTRHFAASASWAGDEWIAGLNIKPFRQYNAQVTLAMGDVTDRVDGRRYLLAVAWVFDELF
ncbi:hypothetical protein [Ectothiorhodospira shaposhnikovii]|uniref:hypothetical protein n=1 Tax=Ectothiorhodospira shaposhnikovii TaxID=1054 RepID=UPI00190497FB|nr:hypothetical protein [Ectothiorhodospira shaposhnikovii]